MSSPFRTTVECVSNKSPEITPTAVSANKIPRKKCLLRSNGIRLRGETQLSNAGYRIDFCFWYLSMYQVRPYNGITKAWFWILSIMTDGAIFIHFCLSIMSGVDAEKADSKNSLDDRSSTIDFRGHQKLLSRRTLIDVKKGTLSPSVSLSCFLATPA